MIPPISLFVRWVGFWRRYERWEQWDRFRNDPRDRARANPRWPWKDKNDPWTAIVNYLSSHTGISAQAVERYMMGCTYEGEPSDDTYTQGELHKWWESGQGSVLIRKFLQAYPDVAARMHWLPKPIEQRSPRKGRKRSKRTMPTTRELQALELRSHRKSLKEIGSEMGVSKARAGQLLKAAAARPQAPSRSVDLSKAYPLMDHDGAAAGSDEHGNPTSDE